MKNSQNLFNLKITLIKKINTWWEGAYVPEPPGSPFVFGIYQKHWTSSFAYTLVNFHRRKWEFLWGTFTGIFIAYLTK